MGKDLDLVDRLTEAAVEVKQLLSDLHSVRKSLRDDIRDARLVIKDLESAVDQVTQVAISEEVERQMARLGRSVDEQMVKSVAKVTKEFDELSDILMGRISGQPLVDAVFNLRTKRSEGAV